MGWSESYYEDMRKEAERELRRLAVPLCESLDEFRAAVERYRAFTAGAEELETSICRLRERLQAKETAGNRE